MTEAENDDDRTMPAHERAPGAPPRFSTGLSGETTGGGSASVPAGGPAQDPDSARSPGDTRPPSSAPAPFAPGGKVPGALPEVPGVRLEDEIARGGMGVVYRGVQEYIDRRVAVKVLASHLQGEQFVARFRREARLLADLDHPNIVKCFSAGVTQHGDCFLVMEYIAGPTLRQHVKAQGPLAVPDALRAIAALAQALGKAQQAGVIHRDVKPENVLLQPCAEEPPDPWAGPAAQCREDVRFPFVPKLADLGLARRFDEVGELTAPGVVMGTTATMAPEQFDDPDGVDQRADVYGLGCVLYHALTGKPAFRGGNLTETILQKRAVRGPDPRQHRSDLPADVAELVQSMLACNPGDRPQTHGAVAEACTRLAGSATRIVVPGTAVATAPDAGGAASPATAGAGGSEPRRRLAGSWIGLFVVLLIGGGTAAWIQIAAGETQQPPPVVDPPRPEPNPDGPKDGERQPPDPPPGPDGTRDGEGKDEGDRRGSHPTSRGERTSGQRRVEARAEGAIALFDEAEQAAWTMQPAKSFFSFDPGIFNGRVEQGLATFERTLPAARFELTGEIECDLETFGKGTEAAGLELQWPDRPSVVLWAIPTETGLRTAVGMRSEESWPPPADGTVDLPRSPERSELDGPRANLLFRITCDGRALEIAWGNESGTGWRLAYTCPEQPVAGAPALRLFVRGTKDKGHARFHDFYFQRQ